MKRRNSRGVTLLGMVAIFLLFFMGSYNSWTQVVNASGSSTGGTSKPAHKCWSYVTSSKDPTCTEGGYKKYSACGHNGGNHTDYLAPLGHSWSWKADSSTGYNGDGDEHWQECSRCDKERNRASHSYKNHSCECGTTYEYGSKHRFKYYGAVCDAYGAGCTQTLTATVTFDENLPFYGEYTMIDAVKDMEEKKFNKATVSFSTIPYQSEDGGKTAGAAIAASDVYYTYAKYTHGNYSQHLAKAEATWRNLQNLEEEVNVGTYAFDEGNNDWQIGNITEPLQEWTGRWAQAINIGSFLFNGGYTKVEGTSAGGTTYTLKGPGGVGHGIVGNVYVHFPNTGNITGILTGSDYSVWRLFNNGGSCPSPVNVWGYLRVNYRTVDGEHFEGLPDTYRHKSVYYNNGGNSATLSVPIKHAIPDKAGYRFVGYKITSGLKSTGALSGGVDGRPGAGSNASATLNFTMSGMNKTITFYYEKVNLTIRHYNMTDGTTTSSGLRKITTSSNISKTDTFCQQPAGTVRQLPNWPDYESQSLSKFWWPAYNLEYATVSTSSSADLDNGGTFRKVTFSPYKAFAPEIIDPVQCTNIVNSSNNMKTIINRIYNINNSDLVIDVVERMVNNSANVQQAKSDLARAANILVYGRDKTHLLIENRNASGFKDALALKMVTTKLVTNLEDSLLSDDDKVNQIKKKVMVPYAPSNSKISESAGYRVDKYINYYYTTTEIMVNNINLETNTYMQSSPDTNGVTYDLRTKVPIRDTVFRAESLITTPPAIEDYKYTYSVYNPTTKAYTRREYNISGFILEKFDIKVGDEVLLEIRKEDVEDAYKIDGTNIELYPPFTDQFIIDTSDEDGVASLVSAAIGQIDLNRLDKDASINFYYKDVSLLRIKYVRDTDYAEIHPSKTVILGSEPSLISPENLEPSYVCKERILDGTTVPNLTLETEVSVSELPGGQDRTLIFVYKVPQLAPVEAEEDEQRYVDLRSNDRVAANKIKQEAYPDAPARLDTDGKYSATYKSLEEYNSYNDQERKADQTNEGIPTLEDIYANVVTEQFLMDNALSIQPTTQKIQLKLVKKYYTTNTKDDESATQDDIENLLESGDDIEDAIEKDIVKVVEVDLEPMEVPYQYYGASGADLKILENAMVYNNVIFEVGGGSNQTELIPTYQKPYMNYIKNGYLHIPVERNYDTVTNGMEDYRKLASGFYSVDNPENRGETLTATLVLEGIDEYEPSEEKLKREYQAASGLILNALQNANTLIRPDRLTVTYNASANGQDNAFINEFLVVTDDFNLDVTGKIDKDNNMRLGRTYTADDLVTLGVLHTDEIPLVGTDVLYKKDNLFVETKTTNGTHGVSELPQFSGNEYINNTIAEVKYILYQTIKDEEVVGGKAEHPELRSLQEALGAEYDTRTTEAVRIQTIVGYPVVVHTPVVNASKFDLGDSDKQDYSNANNHTVNSISGTHGSIVLGQRFDVAIPHKGQHITSVGYNNNIYNYQGLIANGSKSSKDNTIFNATYDEKFAIIKQIRFDQVGVILYTKDMSGNIVGGKYYEKNTWIDLPLSEELYTFTIPEWEEEIWKDREIKVETRVAAENIPNYDDKNYYLYYSNTNASSLSYNKTKPTYGVWKTFYFKVIGELRDLEIRATNDPAYSNYRTEGTASMPIGQKGQGNGGVAYQYGIKLGYSVYFDIMSTGWTGDTTENVKLTPNFYFIEKNDTDGKAEKVDLYYKVVGNTNYIKLEGTGVRTLSTIMNVDAVKGSRCKSIYACWKNKVLDVINSSGYFAANAGIEMSNTNRMIVALGDPSFTFTAPNYVKEKAKKFVNYGQLIETGNTNAITLPYSVRLAYINAITAMKNEKYAGIDNLTVIPENVKDYSIGHWYGAYRLPASTVAVDPGVTPQPDKSNTKKDGYIIVTFEDVKSNTIDGTDYLEVGPERYKQEGLDTTFTLPNGEEVSLPNPDPNPIPAIIYETDFRANNDYELGGTH